jgi:hypothetical protein
MGNNKIKAELVSFDIGGENKKFIFFYGDVYPENTRAIPITVDELVAIVDLIVRISEKNKNENNN